MVALFNAFALALLITTISAYRFQLSKRIYIISYFLGLFAVNFIIDYFFLPQDIYGVEVGLACLGIWGFFMVVSRFVGRLLEK